ncbi:MAG: T9SS type A sorting domain-containing protein [Melioribacteraceae bacterium]
MKQKLTFLILLILAINIQAGIGVGYSPDAPLPVELTTFTVSTVGNNIELSWATATEVNNYGFEIERQNQVSSIKNQDKNQIWESISFMEGSGNSNSIKYYEYKDSPKSTGKYSYRLKQIDIDGTFIYSQILEVEFEKLPIEFSLGQNYPNPFNPTTVISYSIPTTSNVSITVFDLLGNEIATLVNENKQAGKHKVNFNASQLSNGVYFYKLEAENFIDMKKMILLK